MLLFYLTHTNPRPLTLGQRSDGQSLAKFVMLEHEDMLSFDPEDLHPYNPSPIAL